MWGGTIYNTLTAEALMTTGIISAEPTEDVITVACMMPDKRIHRILVCEDSKIAGIVSTFDMLTARTELDPSTSPTDQASSA